VARPPNTGALVRKVLTQLRKRRVLLQSDASLPSVASIVTGESIRGSWWSHPKSHAIHWTLEGLDDSPEVLQVKLLAGKVTLVHRSLWPALVSVGSSGDAWQIRGLSEAGQTLLSRVRRSGMIRLDRLRAWSARKKPGEAARELELRLLVASQEIHTKSGAHTKQLESWSHLADRLGLGQLPPAGEAQAEIERFVPDAAKRVLPWM
jgi:hypothetical protein